MNTDNASPSPAAPQARRVDPGAILLVLIAVAALCTAGLFAMIVFRLAQVSQTQGTPATPGAMTVGADHVGGDAALQPSGASGGGEIPVSFPVPDFQLTTSTEQPLSLGDMQGKVWIASFVFTRCPAACPVMTSMYYRLQELLKKELPDTRDARLLSISIDPEHDTPAVLAERARIAHSDPAIWLWVTGDKQQVVRLAIEGFKISVADNPSDPNNPFTHSSKFMLVDRQGVIRRYYDGMDPDMLPRLVGDMKKLLAEAAEPAVAPQ
ncbi:MAG: SCO family protein [Phycisphaeraceae bacterium]